MRAIATVSQARQSVAKSVAQVSVAPPIVHDALRSPGRPLDPETQATMGAHFGHDFSQVRVHADTCAAESAQAVQAIAYTVGRDIVFGAGRYAPRTLAGRRLLTHELTHVVQQGVLSGLAHSDLTVGRTDESAEREASVIASAATAGSAVSPPASRHAPAVARDENQSAPRDLRLDGQRSPFDRVDLLQGWRLHLVQRQQESGWSRGVANLERGAQAAVFGDRRAIVADPPVRRGAAPPVLLVQCQGDRAAIRARLQEIETRLTQLRARHQQLSDSFTSSAMQERQRESLARGTERLHAQARTESAARLLWGGSFSARRILQAVSASLSGNTATLTANLRIAYLALLDQTARQHAATDIPRIESAIRDVWQVNISTGDYAGIQFRLLPRITYVANSVPAPTDAFLIQVRGPDTGPSSGDAVHGIISLAPVHLQGSRVIVVAHELAHLFGFVDAYLTSTRRGPRGVIIPEASVGRQDARNRPDLLGMIDPVILERWQRSGAVTAQQVARQTAPVHVWEEDASIVLRTLGVAPPAPQRPTPDSEEFDPQVELDRVRREGEARLGGIRARRERVENSLQSLEIAEEVIRLEREERELRARLGSSP